MFNIAMCDDNPAFLKLLEGDIRNICAKFIPDSVECYVGPSFLKAEDVLTYIKNNPIDVLFLDIDMPNMNGFDLANILCKDYKDTIIVFMSAYDNFVYDSFEFSPFAYLRKNRMSEEVPCVLTRIVEKISNPAKQLIFNTKEGNMAFYVKEILYFESKHNYFTIYCTNKRSYDCRGTLSQVENMMTQFNFFRIHAAFIVNMDYVSRIMGASDVLIKDKLLPVSKRRMPEFRKVYTEYTRRCVTI